MKNQKGFSLVELMVVMAIIAILSTAGISQYGRFIKNARDTTRVADLNALNIVILDSIQATGTVPTSIDGTDGLKEKIKEVAGKDILDPLDGGNACLEDDGANTTTCQYYYTVCDGGTGYLLGTHFESKNNVESKYDKDDVSTSDSTVLHDHMYELGSCNEIDGLDAEELTGASA